MTAKNYLEQARQMDRRIDAKIEEVARLRSKLMRITATISDMPRGGNVDWTDTVAHVLELEEELNAEIDRFVDVKRDIACQIACVTPESAKNVLEMRYLSGWSWKKIAGALHYDRTSVWRLHSAGLAQIRTER